ncbi:sigma 54-interacting transcriptional regulator [Bacillus sp. DX4.1]|uniref:sigma 54-interacting transcriptional regulator n=1 Tax=Bacillus sp. DX4.1 TaxID=3055867 RepID=UPI0025A03350|nr:sigma 54-interacting transcriptional regulator [Bacillus sp. DX4.1]MDM5189243.1 sigma 54-interacting transcriptional regulator [Bacillus sp. DX4.1]
MKRNQKGEIQFSHAVLEAIHNEILIMNKAGIVLYCNEAACKLLNMQRATITGCSILTIMPTLQVFWQEKSQESFECNVQEKKFAIMKTPIYENKEIIGLLLMFQNVTNEENSIEHLKETLEKYEDALNLLSECILGVDEKGNINFLSRSYANLLGIDNLDSAIGKHCTEVVENTRMHIVTQTGEAEVGHIQRVGDRNVIATRIPIMKEGRTIGAVGKIMFRDVRELKVLVTQIQAIESKLAYYQKELKRIQGAKYSFQSIIGNSKKIQEVKKNAKKAAQSNSTILIKGETGTGKELFAHAIHLASPRAEGPLIRLNCAAIPRELFEAELFGYEEGSFTGAKKGGRQGKFELAQHGTLFLDEIGEMPFDMQAKLLRVLQEKEFERVGGAKVTKLDVRFIAATNQDLREMVRQGKFREDLYYRLNVFMLEIPPLRERKEDIMPLKNFLIQKLNLEFGGGIPSVDEKVMSIFMEYNWPGNIRELENILERSINVLEENTIQTQHLPVYVRVEREEEKKDPVVLSLQEEVEAAEKRAIIKALQKVLGNKQEAAKMLGIHRASLYRKLEKYNLLSNSYLANT